MKYLLLSLFSFGMITGKAQGIKDVVSSDKILYGINGIITTDYPKQYFDSLESTMKTTDTIKVIALYCDTVDIQGLIILGESKIYHKIHDMFWKQIYEVRNIEYKTVDISINPNHIKPDGSTTLLSWYHRYEQKPVYTRIGYLDMDKKPLSKSIIVWETKEVN